MKRMKKLLAAVFAALMVLSLFNASLVAADAEYFMARYEELHSDIGGWLYDSFGLDSIFDIWYIYGEDGLARLEIYSFSKELRFARPPHPFPCRFCNRNIATEVRLEGDWAWTRVQYFCSRVSGALEAYFGRPITIQNVCGSCGVTDLVSFVETEWICLYSDERP